MKIYISMDAEGVTGIYKLAQVMPGHPEYEFARRMMAHDINAAARGALRAGAEEIIVNDGHNSGDNLLIDELDPGIQLISGFDRPLGMAQGAELGADAALLVGYHRRKGAKGVISHSYSYGSMVEMRLNGSLISEYDLVGCLLGCYGIPVVFLSGDDLVCRDAEESIPGLYTAVTKQCIGNGSALCYHPARTAALIEDTVERALKNYKADGIEPMTLSGEIELDVRYTAETQAALAMGARSASRVNENTVRFSGADYMDVYKSFMAGALLAGSFREDAALYT